MSLKREITSEPYDWHYCTLHEFPEAVWTSAFAFMDQMDDDSLFATHDTPAKELAVIDGENGYAYCPDSQFWNACACVILKERGYDLPHWKINNHPYYCHKERKTYKPGKEKPNTGRLQPISVAQAQHLLNRLQDIRASLFSYQFENGGDEKMDTILDDLFLLWDEIITKCENGAVWADYSWGEGTFDEREDQLC